MSFDLAEACRLRLKMFSEISLFRSHEKSFTTLKNYLEYKLTAAKISGSYHFFNRKSGKAFLIRNSFFSDFFRCQIDEIILDYEINCRSSAKWIQELLLEQKKTFGPSTIVDLTAGYSHDLNLFTEIGFKLDSTILVGDPSLPQAMSHQEIEYLFAKAHCEFRPLQTSSEIDRVIAIKKNVFFKQPHLCWFYNNLGHSDDDRSGLLEEIESIQQGSNHFVIRHQGEIQGYFGFSSENGPFWGKVAGMDFAFQPVIRNQGLGRAAYQILFKRMLDQNIDCYKGGTANPAVLHLARNFERQCFQLHLHFQV